MARTKLNKIKRGLQWWMTLLISPIRSGSVSVCSQQMVPPLFLLVCVLSAPAFSGGTPQNELAHYFDLSARLSHVPVQLLRAVCWVESNHRPNVRVRHDGPASTPAGTGHPPQSIGHSWRTAIGTHISSRTAEAATLRAPAPPSTPSYGICQLKLQTARDMGFTGTGKELMQPHLNIYYAAQYLAYQLKRYHGSMRRAIKAYNRGHCKGSTNCEYVRRVMRAYKEGR